MAKIELPAFIRSMSGTLYKDERTRVVAKTYRHNGKVERQNRLDQDRFYDRLKMYSLKDGRMQLAAYQRKSNSWWKTCLGMKSPNDVIAAYHGVL